MEITLSDKLESFIQKRNKIIISIGIIVQIIVTVAFFVLYYISPIKDNSDITLNYKIYVTCIIAIFEIFMIHFAFHSLSKAYAVELLAFILMSTIHFIICIYIMFILIKTGSFEQYLVYAIVMIVVTFLILIVYYITAYYSYNQFDEILLGRIGSKVVYHDMFKINQSLHAVNKIDTGLVMAFCTCYLCYEYNDYLTYILSSVYVLYMLAYLFMVKYGLKNENKKLLIIPFIVRLLLISLNGYIIYLLIQTDHDYFKSTGKYIIIINSVISCILLGLECFFTFKCCSNFGKGLKEMVKSQEGINYSIFDSGNSVNTDL